MISIKPIAWFTEDHLTDKSATTYDICVVERWINKGWPVNSMVLHSDHEAEVARLRAELQNAAKAALDAVALCCEKEREADALRAEVEGLRFAASEVADFLVCLPGMSKNDVEIVASRLVEQIDAAMGASA